MSIDTTDAAGARRDARAARRMLHRSRSVWISVALIVAIALAILAIVEAVLRALGLPPALVDPRLVHTVVTQGGLWAWVTAGAALVLGLVCLWGALAPGSTHRRMIVSDRAPIVIDDGIVAGAISRTVSGAARVAPGQVTTRLGARRAVVDVTTTSGFALDRAALVQAGDGVLDAAGLGSTVTARVQLASKGRLS